MKEKEGEIQSLKEQMKMVESQFQIILQKVKEVQKMSNYVHMRGKNTTDKLGITESQTKKELEEFRKRILESKMNKN